MLHHTSIGVTRDFEQRITVEPIKAEDLPFREKFDGVKMTNVFHELLPVELRERVLGVCYQVLKRPGSPGGSSSLTPFDGRHTPGGELPGHYWQVVMGEIMPEALAKLWLVSARNPDKEGHIRGRN